MAARASFAIPPFPSIPHSTFRIPHSGGGAMLSIDLRGKRALVAGVADDGGYGFAITKALVEAGATVCAGTWPPALNIFLNLLERGKIDESRRLPDGSLLQFEKIYPLDAAYDTLAEAPDEVRGNKRYKDGGGMSSAKAALESDTRTLAFEAGRKYGLRVNTISAGPLASRAASAIGKIERMVEYYAANAPLTQPLTAREVGTTAAFLASPLGSGITGATIYVDKGYHAMGAAVATGNLL